jgi:hypothetical protein
VLERARRLPFQTKSRIGLANHVSEDDNPETV